MTKLVNLKKLKKSLGAKEYRRRLRLIRRACAPLALYDDDVAEYYASRFEEVILRSQAPDVFMNDSVLDRMQTINSLVDNGLIQ